MGQQVKSICQADLATGFPSQRPSEEEEKGLAVVLWLYMCDTMCIYVYVHTRIRKDAYTSINQSM